MDGTDGQPINIRGPKDAIVKGDDSADSCFEINHNHYVLDVSDCCATLRRIRRSTVSYVIVTPVVESAFDGVRTVCRQW